MLSMPYKPQANHPRNLGLFGAIFVAWGCGAKPSAKILVPTSGLKSEDGVGATMTPETTLVGPWLVPRLDRLSPRLLHRTSVDEVELIAGGQRLTLHADGSYEASAQWLPLARTIRVRQLPQRLGSGYVFALSSSEDTWIYRSERFASPLVPIGIIDAALSDVVTGYDRVLFRIASSGDWVSLDEEHGALSLDTHFPILPDAESLAVVDAGFGAFVDPFRGLRVSTDGGVRFDPVELHALGSPLDAQKIRRLDARGGRLLITLQDSSEISLDRSGTFVQRKVAPFLDWDETSSDAKTTQPKLPSGVVDSAPLLRKWIERLKPTTTGGWPIEQALLRGASTGKNQAVYIHGGKAIHVALPTGRVTNVRELGIATQADCAVQGSERQAFALCYEGETTTLFALDPGEVARRLAFWEERRTWDHVTEFGVTLRGPCSLTAAHLARGSRNGQFCAISAGGERLTMTSRDTASGAMSLLVAPNHAVLWKPPAAGSEGELSHYGAVTKTITVKDEPAGPRRALRDDGLFLRGISFLDGQIAGYVRRGDFVQGYRVTLEGELLWGDIKRGAVGAILRAPYGLIPSRSGYAEESQDGGLTWARVALPTGGVDTLLGLPGHLREAKCSRVGCLLGDWMRIGWSETKRGQPLSAQAATQASSSLLPVPPRIGLPKQFRQLPQLHCRVIGPVRSRQSSLHAQGFGPSTPRDVSSSFYGADAPAPFTPKTVHTRLLSGERFEARLLAKTVGPATARATKLHVSVMDTLGDASVWSSLGSPIGLVDDETLERWFQTLQPSGSVSAWRVLVSSEGQSALITLEDVASPRAFVVTRDKPVAPLAELPNHTFKRITDYVSTRDAVYLLGSEPTVALFSIAQGSTTILHDFDPRARLGKTRLRLVRDAAGTGIGYYLSTLRLKSTDANFYIYPIDPSNGRILEPERIPTDTALRSCTSTDTGWLLETELAEIARLRLTSRDTDVAARATVLLLGSKSGLCMKRLSLAGLEPAASLGSEPGLPAQGAIPGVYKDTQGTVRRLSCDFESSP